ncbi:MAG: chemotaxis response regulator protein-glutamate methylesterase [Desulfobulbaceae bacterium]|nr:chemotaxis response regulator protein-glutamate methylesterase [Desulfobulbaceae bacterium]
MVGKKIRVLVVDDTVLYRKVLTDVLARIPNVEVVGSAGNGRIGLNKIEQLRPDLMTLDFEMPVMDGLQTLRELKKKKSDVAVIMVSAHTSAGAAVTMEALELGAYDFIAKPSGGSLEQNREALLKQLKPVIQSVTTRRILSRTLRKAPSTPLPKKQPVAVPSPSPAVPLKPAGRIDIVAVGISTGGPNALAVMIPLLPKTLRTPVVIVQHMPPVFTKALADSLDKKSAVHVKEAEQDELIQAGCVYIAPGGKQMKLTRRAGGIAVDLTDDPPENHCRPAADYLFRSVSKLYDNRALGVIMTGMGSDGVLGLRLMKRRGARVIGQDEATCVVYGMPMEASKAEVTDVVLPLARIAPEIVRMVK